MKYFWINGNINDELFKSLLTFFNENEECAKTVYITGDGGDMIVGEAIIDLLSVEKPLLVAHGQLHSATLRIFVLAKTSKQVLPCTCGFHHLTFINITLNDLGKPRSHYDKAQIEDEMLDYNSRINDINKIIKFTKEEKKRLNNNEDVYISTERLRKCQN